MALTRIFGQRSLGSFSTFDFPVAVAMGAIVGRTALVRTSLASGVVALSTLFAIQAGLAFLRNRTRLGAIVDNRPLLLVEAGNVLEDNLRRAHLTRQDLYERLRQHSVCSISEVAAVVIERNGVLSVAKGRELDPELLSDVER